MRPSAAGSSLVLLGALALAAACGDDHGGSCEGHSHDPSCLVCEGDEDPVTAGSVKAGAQGNLSIEIVSVTPSPPMGETNHVFVVRVLDADGAAVEGATISKAEPWYPPGGHGTPLTATIEETSPGEYTVSQVNFLHGGRWELRWDLADGATTDAVVHTLCIEPGPNE